MIQSLLIYSSVLFASMALAPATAMQDSAARGAGEAAKRAAADIEENLEAEAVEGTVEVPDWEQGSYVGSTGIAVTDYPPTAWRDSEEGTVVFELTHDVHGAITECSIVQSSGSAVLDAATCPILMKRAEIVIEPVPETGEIAAGTISGSHNWRIRENEFDVFSMAVAFTVQKDGELRDCEVMRKTGTLPDGMEQDLARNPCPPGIVRGPYRNGDGEPIERRMQLNLSAEELPLPAE